MANRWRSTRSSGRAASRSRLAAIPSRSCCMAMRIVASWKAERRAACPCTTSRCRCSRARSPIGHRSASSRFPLGIAWWASRRLPIPRSLRRWRCPSRLRRLPPSYSRAAVRPTPSRPEDGMETSTARAIHDPAADFYIDALRKLQDTNIPFLIGGAFAFSHHAHVPRDTKDIDVFVKPDDCPRVLDAFEQLGYRTELPFPHWLGKIRRDDYSMDVIFNSGNGIARVDDLWFEHAPKTNVLGLIVRLSPVEEMIWSKAFIQERERFDGADVLHLLRETGPSLDWPRLLMRFGDYWRVLLSHLILFGFVYPDKRQNIPNWVMEELTRRLTVSRPNLQSDTCYGTLLSREQYLHDIDRWKYRDGREQPDGPMTREQIEIWTAAIRDKS